MKLSNIKSMSEKEIRNGFVTLTTSVQAVQKVSHNLAIQCAIVGFRDGNWNPLKFGINVLENVGGSFRVEAFKQYCREFFGVIIEVPKDDTRTEEEQRLYPVNVTKDKDWKGSRDSKQLDKVKANPWYNWAPNEKPLNTPTLSASHWIQAARGLATGDLSKADVAAEYGEFGYHKVLKLMEDKKIQSWAVKYLGQQGFEFKREA